MKENTMLLNEQELVGKKFKTKSKKQVVGKTRLEANKKFKHNILSTFDLESESTDKGRFYKTPNGNFPSVTTVLNQDTKEIFKEWRKHVGNEYADRVSRLALTKGLRVHELVEGFLNNKKPQLSTEMPHIAFEAKRLFDRLEKNVSCVYGTELAVWSNIFEMAGRVDAILNYNNHLSVVDFKTSKSYKKAKDIENYFLQGACYACMIYERFQIKVKNIVILMIVDNGDILEFVKPVKKEYIQKIKDYRDRYRNIHGL